MGYRDEKEQLRAKVETLEGELADAHETIARLTGVSQSSPAGDRETRNAILDAPAFVGHTRELELEVTEEGLEAIAELVRERTKQPVQQVGRTLTGAHGFSLKQEGGRTTIEMERDFGGTTLAAIGSSLMVGGFASVAGFALFHDLVMRSVSEANVLWLVPLGTALAFAGFRKLFQTQARNDARDLRGTVEAVVELAHRHRVPAAPKMRVTPAAENDVEDEVPAELDGDEARSRSGS